MRAEDVIRKVFVVLAFAIVELSANPLRAQDRKEDAGALRAEMKCEHVDAPGRVHCEVEARAGPGESIHVGDVIIVRTPSFVTALRGRIGPHDATTREAQVWRWAFALAAHTKGTGDVEARVRVVVCRDAACQPREVPVLANVSVGE